MTAATDHSPPCTNGHRPDDMPEPGDRCKDCGWSLSWEGPGAYDWIAVDPPGAPAADESAPAWRSHAWTDHVEAEYARHDAAADETDSAYARALDALADAVGSRRDDDPATILAEAARRIAPRFEVGDTIMGDQLHRLPAGTRYTLCDLTGRPAEYAIVFQRRVNYTPTDVMRGSLYVVVALPEGH